MRCRSRTTLHKLDIGKGELLVKGNDVLLLPVGNRVYPALEAAEGLEKVGIRRRSSIPGSSNPWTPN